MANRTARRYRDERDKNLADKAELARAKYDAQAAGECLMAAEARATAAEAARDAAVSELERLSEELAETRVMLCEANLTRDVYEKGIDAALVTIKRQADEDDARMRREVDR